MLTRTLHGFRRDLRGSVAVEFVALMPAFLFLTLFIIEIAVAVFWVGTAEKAAQLGARLAIVSNKAVSGLPVRNTVTGPYFNGDSCGIGACVQYATRSCSLASSGDCDLPNFNIIVNRMVALFPLLGRSPLPAGNYVTITYSYSGLGHAGGPIVPSVFVTIQGVPYGTFMTTVLAGFMRLVTRPDAFTANPAATSPLTNLPTITAIFTGEDLSSAGAS